MNNGLNEELIREILKKSFFSDMLSLKQKNLQEEISEMYSAYYDGKDLNGAIECVKCINRSKNVDENNEEKKRLDALFYFWKEKNKINKLNELLDTFDVEKDDEVIETLKWAILQLEWLFSKEKEYIDSSDTIEPHS